MIRWLTQIWQGFREWLHEATPHLIIFGLLLMFLILFEWHKIVVVIHSGEVGVEYKVFSGGTITDHVYPEGVHLLWPWNTMYIYNIRVQETERQMEILTNDGLNVEVDVSVRFRPEVAMVGVLQQQVGLDYANKVVVPEVESAVRTSVGKLSVEALYSGLVNSAQPAAGPPPASASATPGSAPGSAAAPLESALPEADTTDTSLADAFETATDQAAKRFVVIDKVLITRIKLPDPVEKAIEEKMKDEETAEAGKFRIAIAQNEAQSNGIVTKSLDENLLRLKAIQAIEDLAKSPNSKVVVIGNDRNSFPLMLGSDK